MEPITVALKTLKRTINEITISPGKISVDYNDFIDFGDPVAQRAWDMQYKEPEIVEADHYIINHKNYNGVGYGAFKEEFQKVRDELTENIKVLGINGIAAYVEGIITYFMNQEAKIIENEDGTFKSDIVVFMDCDAERINNSFLRNSYNDFLEGLKRTLRSEISYYQEIEKKLPKMNSGSNVSSFPQPTKDEMVNPLASMSPVLISGFTWCANRSLEKDMIILYGLLTEHGIIPRNTDIKDIRYAFSGKPLQKVLRIRWLVKGKNKQTSKSSLFHFISRLEDFKLIENKEWLNRDYSELYKKLSIIFSDSDGELFSIDGLSSSRSQGLVTRCAMEDEIDRIVKEVAESDSFRNSIPK